jgi:molecular chaperone HtpG
MERTAFNVSEVGLCFAYDFKRKPRFNVWSVGEVHVVERRIVPNGRRDHFEQNAHFHNLVNHLTPTARSIARRCRTSSVRRKWLREFELHRQGVAEKLGMITQGSLGPTKRKKLALSIERAMLQMEKIAGKDLLTEDSPDELRATVRALRVKLGRTMKDKATQVSPLARLPPQKRAMYEHLFDLVYECSANRTAAKALIDRILLKLGS